MGTACHLLGFDNVLTRAQKQMDAFVDHPDGSKSNPQKLRALVGDFEDVAVRAPDRLAAQLRAMSTPFDQLAEIFRTGNNTTLDLQGYRAGGIEVLSLCGAKAL